MTAGFGFAEWFGHVALGSLVVMAAGAVIAKFVRQPIDRLQILVWTLIAAVVIPALTMLPGIPRWQTPFVISLNSQPTVQPIAVSQDATELTISTANLPTLPDRNVDHSAHAQPTQSIASTPNLPLAVPPKTLANVDRNQQIAIPQTQEMNIGWLIPTAFAIYLAVALMMVVRWCVAYWKLARLYRRSETAPTYLQKILSEVAQTNIDHVELRVSQWIDSPLTWGRWKPVIMLPASTSRDDGESIRCAVAHEWSHIERRDSNIVLLTAISEILFFYQPIFWWLKRQVALCQDYLADAKAAEFASSTEDYAQLLVNMARQRKAFAPAGALGIGDRKSRLFARITMLVQSHQPLKHQFTRLSQFVVAAMAMMVALGVSTIQVTSADETKTESKASSQQESTEKEQPADKQPANKQSSTEKEQEPKADAKETEADKSDLPDPIVYQGKVTNRATGEPIEGVTVEIVRQLSRDPKTGNWITLETTEHKTNKQGVYEFTLPPEQVAESSLYIVVDAHHPKFASKGRSGYSHTMIRKNLKLGEEPFYAHIKLSPGEPITGVVESPDGKRLSDVPILIYSKSGPSGLRDYSRGSFHKAKTDEKGHFSVTVHTPGDGVLWIQPENHAPAAYRLKDKRGDWGIIKVKRGKDLEGVLLDTDGKPIAGMKIELRRSSDGEEPDEFLNQNAVANGIRRECTSDESGKFVAKALPEGEFRLTVSQERNAPREHVFLARKITVSDDEKLESIEVRAEPQVFVRATVVDSSFKPRSGHRAHVFGRINGNYYFTQSSSPGKDGKMEIRLPHGLQETRVSLSTNEHSALRWRMNEDSPMMITRDIKLGTIEDDVEGIQIVRYKAPILLVKAVDAEGNLIENASPKLMYEKKPDPNSKGEMIMYVNGGNVYFEKQKDGRHRTGSLLPDQKFNVSFVLDGYKSESKSLELKEGIEKEVSIILTKDPTAKSNEKKTGVNGIFKAE